MGLNERHRPSVIIETEHEPAVLNVVFDDMVYGGPSPDRGQRLNVLKRAAFRKMSSAFDPGTVDLDVGAQLEYRDTLANSEMAFLVRGGEHNEAQVVLTWQEFADLRDKGVIKDAGDFPNAYKEARGKLSKVANSPSAKASRSVFVQSGVFSRVSKDFPTFPKRPLMRSYLKLSSDEIADEMPPPIDDDKDDGRDDGPEPRPKKNIPSATSKDYGDDDEEDEDAGDEEE